jgi:hypothetical protein
MIADVRQRLQAGPFEPFVIVTSSGHRCRVATADHAGVNPQGSRVILWFDDESSLDISGLHIAAIEKEPAAKNGQSWAFGWDWPSGVLSSQPRQSSNPLLVRVNVIHERFEVGAMF